MTVLLITGACFLLTLYAEIALHPSQGTEKIERTLVNGKTVGDLSFFFGMRHLGDCHHDN